MSAWILIIWFGSQSYAFDRGAVTTQEFNSQASCYAAAQAIKKTDNMAALCVAK